MKKMTNSNNSKIIRNYAAVFGVGSLINTAGAVSMELTNYSSVLGGSFLTAGTILMSAAVMYMGYHGQKILNKKEVERQKESKLADKIK